LKISLTHVGQDVLLEINRLDTVRRICNYFGGCYRGLWSTDFKFETKEKSKMKTSDLERVDGSMFKPLDLDDHGRQVGGTGIIVTHISVPGPTKGTDVMTVDFGGSF
jgi:hypothetical protein